MTEEKQIEEMARDLENHTCMSQFQAEIASKMLHILGYRKQSEWISVEERLPSEDERRDEYYELVPFLVCEKGTRYPYRAMYDGVNWGDGLMKIRGITHWMPLPEPPKTKGGAE